MSAFYNERDPFAAAWLRNLIDAGHIAPGVVDERDVRDIRPNELAGFTQCHFFAGIGVWPHALRRAGWSDDRQVWTGSCPCQPFSAAGAGKGFADERHLWPHWFHLIAQHGPAVVLGEQVASKDGLGWLDLVSADLEGAGYAFAASDLCAAGVGGAHIRQRLYFVGLADTAESGRTGVSGSRGAQGQRVTELRQAGGLAYASDGGRREQWSALEAGHVRHTDGGSDTLGGVADTKREQRFGRRPSEAGDQPGAIERAERLRDAGEGHPHAPTLGRDAADWLFCRDGKWRPVEPGTFPLAHAAPARVGRLRAYGNALDAATATAFVEAVAAIMPASLELAA